MFLPIAQPCLSFSWYMVIACLPRRSDFSCPPHTVPEHHLNHHFHLRQQSNGSSPQWASLLSDVYSSHVSHTHTHTHTKYISNVCAHTKVWCMARTHSQYTFRHFRTYHAHRKLMNCHIRLWSNAETIFKKQQNAIFSESKTNIIIIHAKTHVLKTM